jgi:hypothetical protein
VQHTLPLSRDAGTAPRRAQQQRKGRRVSLSVLVRS